MNFKKQPPAILRKVFPGAVWRLNSASRSVVLTFDDGPVEGVTDWVLDVLKAEGIRAVFFCVGQNVERNQQLFQRILDEGHQVGNHSYSHLNGMKTSKSVYFEDIEKAQKLYSFRYFRPPYGRISPAQYKFISADYRVVFWDVLTEDYDRQKSVDDCLKNVVDLVRPGSLIVFHDSLKANERLRELLPASIHYLRSMNYEFVLLPD